MKKQVDWQNQLLRNYLALMQFLEIKTFHKGEV